MLDGSGLQVETSCLGGFFVEAQVAILGFLITAGVSWRKELFCIPL